ncbi:MAG: M20 family metallopeptidase [Rikenellaceae bacterium]
MDATQFRRHLHRNPELSFEEFETAKFISTELTKLGVSHRPIAKTGILAKIEGRGDLKRAVVLRADIDALPIEEQTGLEYSSQTKGVMHACGHDIHAATLFGVVKKMCVNPDFEGTLFALFQPGEERNPGGASYVLAEEPFEGYDVVAVVGEHVEGQLPVGTVGFREGKYMASSDEIRFNVVGVGGHGAMRHKLKDPVEAAAAFLTKLLSVNREDLVLSIGRFIAEGATNVIPQSVYLEGTMRTFDEDERRATKEFIAESARQIENQYGVEVQVDISHGFPCVVNTPELVQAAREIAQKELSLNVESLPLRTTSEDFGFYTTRYPSLFYRVGVASSDGVCGAPHTATFSPNEEAINVAIELMSSVALKLLTND